MLKAGGASAPLLYLAHVTNILAEVDRGAYPESLDSVAAAVAASDAAQPDADAPPPGSVLP